MDNHNTVTADYSITQKIAKLIQGNSAKSSKLVVENSFPEQHWPICNVSEKQNESKT